MMETKVPMAAVRMAEVMTKLTKLGKDKKAPDKAGGFAYRSIDDLLNALHPLLVAAKLIVFPRLVANEVQFHNERNTPYMAKVEVEYLFYSIEDGTSIVVGPVLGTGTDNLDKMAGKAMTSAFKIAMYQTFCVPVAEASEDPEKNAGDNPRTGTEPTGPPSGPPPAAPLDDSKDQEHREELADISMKLSGGDRDTASGLIYQWSKFIGSDDKEHSINSLQASNDPNKWNPALKGKWLNVIIGRARDALAAAEG